MLDRRWLERISLRSLTGTRSTRATVGLHISADRIAAVRVVDGVPLPVLQDLRQFSLAAGNNDSALRTLAQGDFLAGARIVLVLPAGKYDTVSIANPPAVADDELQDALRWKLRGAIPYPPEEAAISVVRLPKPPGGADGTATAAPVLVVAAQRREVSRAVDPLLAVGANIDVVDIPEMAQHNLLVFNKDVVYCSGFLSFDATSALLTVQFGDELCFARRMPLPGVGNGADEEPEHIADRIAINVQRSLEVFARQTGMPEVAALSLGPHQYAPLIARAIREHAAVDSTLFDPQSILDLGLCPPASAAIARDKLTPELLLAMGAALRGESGRSALSGSRSVLPAWLTRERRAA